ncbi:hypothetical protein AAU61_02780 [Desulfocarbo indianensis]|nr:hypothetical protein AAU61_02780 [Desulfocarbo indianensis]
MINQPGRVGVLATADAAGQPNVAYFGTPQLNEKGELVMGLGENRSLRNLEENPKAAFFVVTKAPVDFQTPGHRLYLEATEIQRQGPVVDAIRAALAEKLGPDAAKMIQAGVVFKVTGARPLVDMG